MHAKENAAKGNLMIENNVDLNNDEKVRGSSFICCFGFSSCKRGSLNIESASDVDEMPDSDLRISMISDDRLASGKIGDNRQNTNCSDISDNYDVVSVSSSTQEISNSPLSLTSNNGNDYNSNSNYDSEEEKEDLNEYFHENNKNKALDKSNSINSLEDSQFVVSPIHSDSNSDNNSDNINTINHAQLMEELREKLDEMFKYNPKYHVRDKVINSKIASSPILGLSEGRFSYSDTDLLSLRAINENTTIKARPSSENSNIINSLAFIALLDEKDNEPLVRVDTPRPS